MIIVIIIELILGCACSDGNYSYDDICNDDDDSRLRHCQDLLVESIHFY